MVDRLPLIQILNNNWNISFKYISIQNFLSVTLEMNFNETCKSINLILYLLIDYNYIFIFI
jgi:hypothetical protein